MSGAETLAQVESLRAFAVVRTETAGQAVQAAEACLRGGIRLLEITLTVPGALEVVSELAARAEAVVGVGSVVKPAQVRESARAGAVFAVSPHFDPAVVAEARGQGLLCSAGALTPTEMVRCHREGVDAVKVFPASAMGGPSYFKAVREPLPFLRLMPTGGVDESNMIAYLEAGAFAFGLGGSLVDRQAVAEGRWAVIEERAARVTAAVAEYTARHRPPPRG